MKRGRNQRRRQGPNPNRALDSNGPDVRIRGTSNQIHEKYLNLARDASSSGDRVKAENYFQHAEHYFRLIKSQQPAQPQQSEQGDADSDAEQPPLGNDRTDARGDNRGEGRGEGRSDGRGRDLSQNDSRSRPGGSEGSSKERPPSETPDVNPEEKSAANGADAPEAGDGDAEKKPRRRRARRPAKADESDAGNEKPATEPAEA